jgi:hypothetical protein
MSENFTRTTTLVLLMAAYTLPLISSPAGAGTMAFAQDEPDTVATEVADTLEQPVRILVIPDLGSLYDPSLPSVSYLEHLRYEYTSTYDNLSLFPGIYLRDKGAVGQPHEITSFGTDWRSIGVLMDGRPLNEPMFGLYDMNLFPTEFIGSVEYVPPHRSFLYRRNATGAAFNIVTQSYIAPASYTKLRYSEGPHNYSQADAVFSQDIRAGLNIMAGMQRQFFGRSERIQQFRGRFPNMNYRNYNYRTKLRWNLSNRLNTALSYQYHTTLTGLSGGVDILATPRDDLFNDLEATVRNNDAFHRLKRHDLTFTAGAILLPDSLDTGTFTVYYSNELREYREVNRQVTVDTLAYYNDHRTLITGIDFKQWFTIGPVRFHAGGNMQENYITVSEKTGKQQERETGAFFRSVFEPFPQVTANVMLRGDWLRNTNYTSYGADLTLKPFAGVAITGGGYHSYRHATLQELHWQDGTVTRPAFLVPEEHDVVFGEFTIEPVSQSQIILGASYRTIKDPIIYVPGDITHVFPDVRITQATERTIASAYANARVRIGDFTVIGMVHAHRSEEDDIELSDFPDLDLSSAIVYRSMWFDGALDIQIKLEAKYFTEQYGMEFNPESYFTTRQSIARFGPSGILNGSIVGKIGSAYIHISYQNITSTEYMRTPFYPMYESYLRFGITWEFLN